MKWQVTLVTNGFLGLHGLSMNCFTCSINSLVFEGWTSVLFAEASAAARSTVIKWALHFSLSAQNAAEAASLGGDPSEVEWVWRQQVEQTGLKQPAAAAHKPQLLLHTWPMPPLAQTNTGVCDGFGGRRVSNWNHTNPQRGGRSSETAETPLLALLVFVHSGSELTHGKPMKTWHAQASLSNRTDRRVIRAIGPGYEHIQVLQHME